MSNKTDRIQVTTEMAIAARTYIETHHGWRFKEAIEAALDVHYNKLQCEEDARPTFEGAEAAVRAGCNSLSQYYSMLPLVIKGVDPGMYRDILKMFERLRNTLALLDAKDAEKAALREDWARQEELACGLLTQRDAALSRAEQAEAALAEMKDGTAFRNLNLQVAEMRKALAELDAEIVAFREDVSEAMVEADRILDACGDYPANSRLRAHLIRRFILPAKPADPLVEVLQDVAVRSAAKLGLKLESYQVEQEAADDLRAAIERAGGVKAVFGEGL